MRVRSSHPHVGVPDSTPGVAAGGLSTPATTVPASGSCELFRLAGLSSEVDSCGCSRQAGEASRSSTPRTSSVNESATERAG